MAELTNDDVLVDSELDTHFPKSQSAQEIKKTTDKRREIIWQLLEEEFDFLEVKDQVATLAQSLKEDAQLLLLANLKPPEKIEHDLSASIMTIAAQVFNREKNGKPG
jgi:hypothetical protein